MKKQLLILALLAAIALAPVIKPAAAIPHMVGIPRWVSPTFTGNDAYFDTDVVAYATGATAKLIVTLYNDYPSDTKSEMQVLVWMDWMDKNETSEEADVDGGQFHTFEVSFEIPATSEASNLYLHYGVIYYKYETNETPPRVPSQIAGDITNFAVYSTDQKQIVDVKRELDATYWPSYGYLSVKARELFVKANIERNLGAQMNDKGEFASALANYQNALNYTKTAISTDVEWMSNAEDTVLSVMDSLKIQMSMLGYGALIFGIGWLFIGIGIIIYAFRRPRPPA